LTILSQHIRPAALVKGIRATQVSLLQVLLEKPWPF